MIDLNSSKHKRIFCFGCSFTNWDMPTWVNILEHHYKDTKTVYNFGRAGAGNYYIFNTIVEKSLEYNFTKDDLILIQWSGFLREDRFKDGNWTTPGNIITQNYYSPSVVNDWFFDEEGMTKRDYSYIHSIQKMLESDNIDYEMFSMNGIQPICQYNTYVPETPVFNKLTTLYHDTLIKLNPSMYDIIYGVGVDFDCNFHSNMIKGKQDHHPLPTQHLLYLEKVFQFNPSDETRTYVDNITKELLL